MSLLCAFLHEAGQTSHLRRRKFIRPAVNRSLQAIRLYVITYRIVTVANGTSPVTPLTTASVAESGDPIPQMGTRVRALREAMGMSLRDLAEKCGVSAAMLSQVERGETSPTLAVATKVAEGLELTLSQLLRLDEAHHVVVIRAKDRRRLRHAGHRVEELTPPLPGQRADVSLHSLSPGASTGGAGDPPIHEPGSRETAVVLTGAVILVIDGQSHQLRQGDSVTFDADLSHRFINQADEVPTTLIAVVSAGLRRS